MKKVLSFSIAAIAIVYAWSCGSGAKSGSGTVDSSSSSSNPFALIAEQEQLMEGSLIDRSPSSKDAQKMNDRNEALDKVKEQILNQDIPTEIDEGMGLKLIEPFKITSLEYKGSINVSVQMEAMVEISEEGVSQREVMFPEPGSPGTFVAVGFDSDGEGCVPLFIKFKGVEGNKGSKYDQEFTMGNKYRLVSGFKITAADARRWGRVAKICVTGIGSPDFNGPVEEMNNERNEYYQKYGR